MPHPDLPELYVKLDRAVQNNLSKKIIQKFADEIADRIRRKHVRIHSRNPSIRLDGWARNIENQPSSISTFLQSTDFQVLQRRDIHIEYQFHKNKTPIYSTVHAKSIDAVRLNKRMILKNPYIAFSPGSSKLSIQSWSRVSSLSKSYNKHLSNSGGNKQSKYLKGIDYESLEFKTFYRGSGLWYSGSTIFFYGHFDQPIGKLPKSSGGGLTKYLKLKCVRATRSKSTGYKTEIHGYPISKQEINRDFHKAPKKVSDLIRKNVLSTT